MAAVTRSSSSEPAVRRCYILAGEIEGTPRRFLLRPGLNSIGSLSSNAVRLSAPGISKRHALVVVESDRLSVEDRASKNGTFVNDSRIENRRIRAGDRLGFGKVTLRLEEIDARDGELAIAFEVRRKDEPETSSAPGTTSLPRVAPGALPHDELEGMEELVAQLCSRTPGHREAALARLAERLACLGACVLRLSEAASPIVLACYGELEERTLADLPPGAPSGTGPEIEVSYLDDPTGADSALTLAVEAPAGDGSLALAVWGPGRIARSQIPILRIFLRLFARLWDGLREAPAADSPGCPASLVFPTDHVRGESAAMRFLYGQMQAVARSDLPILILGETGVGKEGIARILHRSSERGTGPFIAIDCAAIPTELLEVELFGIAQGVATGVSQRQGKFHLARGGTVFLDEIGDMPLDLQAKLLRVLQEKEASPVGGTPLPVDSRILAATNTDLERLVGSGAFRSDLYYRLAGFVLRVPALAERKEDIPALVEHFLRTYCARAGKEIPGMTALALSRLVQRPWPGNVRELEHEVWRLVCLCPEHQPVDSSMIQSPASASERPETDAHQDDNPASAAVVVAPRASPAAREGATHSRAESLDLSAVESLQLVKIERCAVVEALRRCDWNRSQAARMLGISREAVRRRIARYRLHDEERPSGH